jgi:hypothetical protein
MRPTTVHQLMLVLCKYDEKGQGQVYRERDCSYWFASVDGYKTWIAPLQEPGKFYVFPLRGLAPQRERLKSLKKEGFVGVVYDPQQAGEEEVPLDDLASVLAGAQSD